MGGGRGDHGIDHAGGEGPLIGSFTDSAGNFLNNLIMGQFVGVPAGKVTFNASGAIVGALRLESPDVEGIHLATNGATFTATNITMSNATTLDGNTNLGTTGGPILFSSTLDGGNHNLNFVAGPGTVTFVGAVTNIGTGTGAAIAIASIGLVDFQSTVAGNSGIRSTGSLGSTKFSGDVTLASSGTASIFDGSVNFDGMTWSGSNGLTVNGAATLSSGAVSLNSNGGAILFASTLNGVNQNLTIDSGSGTLTIDSGSGTATFQGALTNMGTGSGAAITLASTGLVDFQSTVIGAGGIDSSMASGSTKFQDSVTLASSGTGSTFEGAVNFDGMSWSGFDGLTVNGAATLSSGAVSLNSNGGAILFASTLDGGSQNLSIDSGSGTATL
ncbi:MAG: hypothetical protein NTW56_16185 [Alphaproteobacteria bacterium]|nr:hypothetical protein [Alphaproteobacteria bacterium]